MQRTMKRLVTAALALTALAGGATQTRAEEIFGLTARIDGAVPSLFRFDTATPGTISAPVPITGIGVTEQVLSIDARPATGQLYGITSANRLLTIDPGTGATAFISNITPGTSTISLGLDFNPVTDQLRGFIRGPEGAVLRNIRVNPDTGQTTLDTPLAYAPGDPFFGQVARSVLGLAYTDNAPGTSTTTLYGIDIDRNVLARIEPENQGVLTTVGLLGLEPGLGLTGAQFVGFDISGVSGAAYLTVTPTTGPNPLIPRLYTVDLETGAASFVGTIGEGRLPVIGIAAPVGEVIPEPTSLALLGTGLLGAGSAAVRKRRRAGARAQA